MQLSLNGTPQAPVTPKQTDKEANKQLDKLMWAIQGPIIVYPVGGWGNDIPDDIRFRISTDRLITVMQDSDLAPEIEALWYASSASLEHPLDHDWVNIMVYLTRNYMLSKSQELPDFLKEEITLEEYEMNQLRSLRRFIFNKSFEVIKERTKKAKKEIVKQELRQLDLFMEAKMEEPIERCWNCNGSLVLIENKIICQECDKEQE